MLNPKPAQQLPPQVRPVQATPKPTVPTNSGYPQVPQQPAYTQPSPPTMQHNHQAGGAMPSGANDEVNIEELVSHENPMQLFSDYKKIGEGYVP